MAVSPAAPAAPDPFEFKDGDRVVFLGSTLIEREQKSGYWELLLTLKNRDKDVTFRNLGWSGDTVFGEARGRFDYANAAKCFDQMVSLTKELKPTVVVVCYGQNESFDGKAGVERFTKGLEKLIDALADTKARIVLMSPTPFEKAAGLPDPAVRNANLALDREAIKGVAEKRKLEFVDLFERLRFGAPIDKPQALTDNGVHLTARGYLLTALALIAATVGEGGLGTFEMTVAQPDQEALRSKIVEKNQLFFHRWRPQNETYLLGFRKHEQGKNAAEIAAFDPYVTAAEKDIAGLKKAVK